MYTIQYAIVVIGRVSLPKKNIPDPMFFLYPHIRIHCLEPYVSRKDYFPFSIKASRNSLDWRL